MDARRAEDVPAAAGRGDRPSDLAWWAHGLVAPLGLAGVALVIAAVVALLDAAGSHGPTEVTRGRRSA